MRHLYLGLVKVCLQYVVRVYSLLLIVKTGGTNVLARMSSTYLGTLPTLC